MVSKLDHITTFMSPKSTPSTQLFLLFNALNLFYLSFPLFGFPRFKFFMFLEKKPVTHHLGFFGHFHWAPTVIFHIFYNLCLKIFYLFVFFKHPGVKQKKWPVKRILIAKISNIFEKNLFHLTMK